MSVIRAIIIIIGLLLISVVMMCTGSLMIACLPTYDSIGAWAPALLLLARLLQGLSAAESTAPPRPT